MSYHGGIRAAIDLRTLVIECLRSGGEARPNLDVFIHVRNCPQISDVDSMRVIHCQPLKTQLKVDLAVLEVSLLVHHLQQSLLSRLPVGITDLLLKSLKAHDCVKVIIAKPCGLTFQAMIKAQRQNGALPDKLMEIAVHPIAIRPARDPYPSVAITSPRSQEEPSQNKSRFNKYLHNNSYRAGAVQAITPQASLTPTPSTQASSTPAPTTQATTPQEPSSPAPSIQANLRQTFPAQAAATQTSTRRIDPQMVIPRNSGGQRVDPRVEALPWLVDEARSRKLCYEYHLHGNCGWHPSSCPKAHLTTQLNIYQMSALQFLARGVPCDRGNICLDWKCCFGHRCPFGERCNGGRVRECRFSPDMHFADTRVANQT